MGLTIAALKLTPLIYSLLKATLGATIIVTILSLVDFSILKPSWVYSKADFAAVSASILLTLALGIEIGVSAGVVISIFIHLYKSLRPHTAVVGQWPSTEPYRNVNRHDVTMPDGILSVRVDKSLFFANTHNLEGRNFDRSGRMTYDIGMMDMMRGFRGNEVLVNGVICPKLTVPAGLVRLRILNASNARMYDFGFTDGRRFHQVASDGGLLPAPVAMDGLQLAPAERAEIVVDFSNQSALRLVSGAMSGGMMGNGVSDVSAYGSK